MLNKRVFGKKLAAFSFAALFLFTTLGAATETTSVVEGHVTWAYLSGYDPCVAAVAGLASSRVLWFNDQVLVDNYALGNTWLYATETGAPDPRGHTLTYVRSFPFTDPNGIAWNVTEYQYLGNPVNGEHPAGHTTEGTDVDPPTTSGFGGQTEIHGGAREHVRAQAYYTWVVKLLEAPASDNYPGNDQHELYNFVTLIDTCKFIGSWDGPEGTRQDAPHDGDPYGSQEHTHETYLADLLLGGEPQTGGVLLVDHEVDYRQDYSGSNEGSHRTPYTP